MDFYHPVLLGVAGRSDGALGLSMPYFEAYELKLY
jgi:hypothetical protein